MYNSDQSGCLSQLHFKTKFKFKIGECSLIMSPRNTGKTSYIVHKLYKDVCDEIDHLYVFSEDLNEYSNITDRVYDFRYLSQLVRSLKNSEKNTMIIIDTYLKETDVCNNDGIREILMNGRHLNITFVITSQHVSLLPSSFRMNFENILLGMGYYNDHLRKLNAFYFSMYDDFNMFKSIYGCLEKHNFLVSNCDKEVFMNEAKLL